MIQEGWHDQGRMAELVAINEKLRHEIAERKLAQDALKASESRLSGILSSMVDLVFAFDDAGRFIFHHSPCSGDLYAAPEAFIGRKHSEVMPSHLNEPFVEAFEKNRQGQVAQYEYWLELDSRVRWFLVKLSPTFLAGHFAGSVAVVREITELKQVEASLRGAHAELERRVRKRTAELTTANEQLNQEIKERRRMEQELLHAREEALRNHHRLLALAQAAQTVQRVRTPEVIYRTIGDEAIGLGYHAMIFVLSADGKHLTLSHTTFESAWLRAIEERSGLKALGFRFLPAPGGMLQRVMAGGESVFCACTADLIAKGVPQLERSLIDQLVGMLNIERSIYASLGVGCETYGLLGFAGTDLSEADVPAVTILANQAGIALENAQLLEQVDASRRRLRRLTQQIVSTQEQERKRLSHALHNQASQALTALKINLDLIGEELPVEFGALRQRVFDLAALTTRTMKQLRSLAQDLRPPALDTVGLGPTLEGFCRDFAQRTRLSIDYLDAELPRLPEAVNVCLYRFLQEALTNVTKHACAKRVCVALRYDTKTVSLSVEDDGRGLDAQARVSVAGWPMGIGLLGMQERLESLGGRLEIAARPGQGLRLLAQLPVDGQSEASR